MKFVADFFIIGNIDCLVFDLLVFDLLIFIHRFRSWNIMRDRFASREEQCWKGNIINVIMSLSRFRSLSRGLGKHGIVTY